MNGPIGSVGAALGLQAGQTSASDRDQAAQALFGLYSPQMHALDDPTYRDLTLKMFHAFVEGDLQIQEGVSNDEIMSWANRTFAEELHDGVGSSLPNGWTITSKRIVHAEVKPGGTASGPTVVLDLAIRARNPATGQVGEYQAPVTKGRRNGDPTDEELDIPLSEITKRLAAVASAAVDMDQGYDLAQARQQAGQRYIDAGGDEGVLSALTGGGGSARPAEPSASQPTASNGIGGFHARQSG